MTVLFFIIDGVDGISAWTIATASATEALAFATRYDHEGSSVQLKIVTTRPGHAIARVETFRGENAFGRLREIAEAQPS